MPPTDTTEEILELSIEANLIVSSDAGANAYELRNAYHLAVTSRLTLAKPSNQTNGRKALQNIRYDTLNDDFDY